MSILALAQSTDYLLSYHAESPSCVWLRPDGKAYVVKFQGQRAGEDCTLNEVYPNHEPEHTLFIGEGVALSGGEVFEFPPIATVSALYSLGFAAIMIPALIAFGGQRIIEALRGVG